MTGLVSPGPSLAKLRRHVTCDQGLRSQQGRLGPIRPQPPPRRRLRPVGLLGAPELTGRPELLRPAPIPREDPSAGPPAAGQPPGRDPAHLPRARRSLRRGGRLARAIRAGVLTSYGRGVSSSKVEEPLILEVLRPRWNPP